MKMNEIYEAPVLEVLNVTVECGFQASDVVNPPAGDDEGF